MITTRLTYGGVSCLAASSLLLLLARTAFPDSGTELHYGVAFSIFFARLAGFAAFVIGAILIGFRAWTAGTLIIIGSLVLPALSLAWFGSI